MKPFLLLLFTAVLLREFFTAETHQWKTPDLLPSGQSKSTNAPSGDLTLERSVVILNRTLFDMVDRSTISDGHLEKVKIVHSHQEKKKKKRNSDDLNLILGNETKQNKKLTSTPFETLTEESLSERNDPCKADVSVRKKEVIKQLPEKNVTLYFKTGENFSKINIQMSVDRKFRNKKVVTLSAHDLGEMNHMKWHEIDVLVYVDKTLADEWVLRVSVDGELLKHESLFYEVLSDFQNLKITAFGPSLWKFARPSKQCSSRGPSTIVTPSVTTVSSTMSPATSGLSGNDGSEPNLLKIIIPIIISIIVVVTAAMVALWLRNRFLRKRAQRTDDVELRETEVGPSSGTGLQPGSTRPGSSHDSENSLYGVIH